MSSFFQHANQASAWSCLPGFNNDRSASNLQIPTSMQQQRSLRQSQNEVEALLLSEFNKLSIDEQVKALDDIYSAGSELKENPALIHQLLGEFERQVEAGYYPIYELAVNQDRSYVEDPAFRLKFLRANLHDVKKAVKQMITFLHLKGKYFGAEKIARDITLDDLTPDDLKLMLAGRSHIQAETDRHGRAVFFIFPEKEKGQDVGSEIRILYYMWFNILLPVHSVQMKGGVTVIYQGKPGKPQPSRGLGYMKQFLEFARCIPIRFSAVHLCLKQEANIQKDLLLDMFVRFGIKAMSPYMQERLRIHHGSPIELQYQLSNFGIAKYSLPVDDGGNIREAIRSDWFYKHLEREGGITRHFLAANDDESISVDDEESIENSAVHGVVDGYDGDNMSTDSSEHQENMAIAPPPYTNQDVLLGRGHDLQNHPGNTAFREFLARHQEEYDNAPRLSKRTISKNLTRTLMATGVRFWQKTDANTWIETSFDEAEKKVGQVFRSARKRNNR